GRCRRDLVPQKLRPMFHERTMEQTKSVYGCTLVPYCGPEEFHNGCIVLFDQLRTDRVPHCACKRSLVVKQFHQCLLGVVQPPKTINPGLLAFGVGNDASLLAGFDNGPREVL